MKLYHSILPLLLALAIQACGNHSSHEVDHSAHAMLQSSKTGAADREVRISLIVPKGRDDVPPARIHLTA